MNIILLFFLIFIFPPLLSYLCGLFGYYILKSKKYGHWVIGSSMVYFPFNLLLKSKIVKLCPYKDCSNASCGVWTCPNYKPEINSGRIKRK